MAAGAFALFRLEWDASLFSLFPADMEAVAELRQRASGPEQARTIHVLPPEGMAEEIAFGSEVRAALESVPGMAGVRTTSALGGEAAEAYALWLATQPPEVFAAILSALQPDRAAVRVEETLSQMTGLPDPERMAMLRFDPLRLWEMEGGSGGGMFGGIRPPSAHWEVTSMGPLEDNKVTAELLERIRTALADAGAGDARAWGLTGAPVFALEIAEAMRRDLARLVPAFLVLFLILFLAVYRTWRPLAAVLLVSLIAFAVSLTTAALVFGELNLIGLGFASILFGLGLDYSILVWHQSAHGEGDTAEFRSVRDGIWISAGTTAAAFLALALSDFPGLRQIGILVASGVLASAAAATWLQPNLIHGRSGRGVPADIDPQAKPQGRRFYVSAAALFLVLVIGAGVVLAWRGWPVDAGMDRLAPASLPAWQAQERMLTPEFRAALDDFAADFDGHLERMGINRMEIRREGLPSADAMRGVFAEAGLGAGWSAGPVAVLEGMQGWAGGGNALETRLREWSAWPRLGSGAAERAQHELPWIALAGALMVTVFLRLQLGRWGLVLWCLATTTVSLWLLLGLLALVNRPMTVISLLCLPLIVGLAADHAIHLMMARRSTGSFAGAWRAVGAPLALAAATSLGGFGILAFSSQPVLANLGLTLSLGVAVAWLTSLAALPLVPSGTLDGMNEKIKKAKEAGTPPPAHSPTLYRAVVFAWLTRLVRLIPRGCCHRLARLAGAAYGWTHPGRCDIVCANLRLLHNRPVQRAEARKVYANFAVTLSDYFRMAGAENQEIESWLGDKVGWEILERAHEEGKGGILVCLHQGLFELGGWLVTSRGLPFTIVSDPEPEESLTEWRAGFRGRWGVETIVLGHDGFSLFAWAEPLRRGRLLAVLYDRPDRNKPVTVQLPGGRAEFAGQFILLARMLECPLIPSWVVLREDGCYDFRVLEPVQVEDRGGREATVAHYCQKITDAFLPHLCQNASQWYQFVPLAPNADAVDQPSPSSSSVVSSDSC